MKLFNAWLEVLNSSKNIKLKRSMGFPIFLSDIEKMTYVKKKTWRKRK